MGPIMCDYILMIKVQTLVNAYGSMDAIAHKHKVITRQLSGFVHSDEQCLKILANKCQHMFNQRVEKEYVRVNMGFYYNAVVVDFLSLGRSACSEHSAT